MVIIKSDDIMRFRDRFRQQVMELSDKYLTCPICGSSRRVYRWSMYETAIKCLFLYYRLGAYGRPVHSKEVREAGHKGKGDETRLLDFGLLTRADADGKRGGTYRLTKEGLDFLEGTHAVPEHIWVFGRHNVVQRSDKMVFIREKYKNFDLDQMLRNKF